MIVQRYSFYASSVADCEGEYVLHADYAALEARCAGLVRERDAAVTSRDGYLGAIEKMAEERDAIQSKLAAVEEALKPSAETKAEYMGEFSWKEESLDEYEEPCLRTIYVPWTTIKEIMKAIKARAALADTTPNNDATKK